MQKKIGMVLSGGGGKGAYEIGVIKALTEMGIGKNITAISGTSVGALNMVLFLQNSVQLIEDIWLSLNPLKIFSVHTVDIFQKIYEFSYIFGMYPCLHKWIYSIATEGMFMRDGLEEIIDKYINLDLIKNSKISAYATCCEISSLQKEYFKLNNLPTSKIKDILLASSAIPVVFPPQIIDGKKYIDGGLPHPYGDNTPTVKVYEEGCSIIFVVHLDPQNRTDSSLYPKSKIIDIFPSEKLGGIKGTFDFNKNTIKKKILLGYNNAKSIVASQNLKF